MKSKKTIILTLLTIIVTVSIYKFFFQSIEIIHIKERDTFEYDNLYTKFFLVDHFKELDNKTKTTLERHSDKIGKILRNGQYLNVVYIKNPDFNFFNSVLGDANDYTKDSEIDINSIDIIADCYFVKDSLGNLSKEFRYH